MMMLMIVIPSVVSVSVVAEDDHNIVEYLAPQLSQVLSSLSSKFSEDFKIRDVGLEPLMKTGNKLLRPLHEGKGWHKFQPIKQIKLYRVKVPHQIFQSKKKVTICKYS